MHCKFLQFSEVPALSTFSQNCHVDKKSNLLFDSLSCDSEVQFLLDYHFYISEVFKS